MACVPKHLLDAMVAAELPVAARHIITVILLYANKENGGAYPSIKTLSMYTGVGERRVQYHLTALEHLGFISRRIRPGRTTVYTVRTPDPDDTPDLSNTPDPEIVGGVISRSGGGDPEIVGGVISAAPDQHNEQQTYQQIDQGEQSRAMLDGGIRVYSTELAEMAQAYYDAVQQQPNPRPPSGDLAMRMVQAFKEYGFEKCCRAISVYAAKCEASGRDPSIDWCFPPMRVNGRTDTRKLDRDWFWGNACQDQRPAKKKIRYKPGMEP